MTTARVNLWGTRIGAVTWSPERELGFFEYDPDFVQSGIELSPLHMPLAPGVYSFPELDRGCFQGLPGLLADSLPDRFGSALIDAWLAGQGRRPDSFDPVERLCYTGKRGMGALEFAPSLGERPAKQAVLDLGALVELASTVLTERTELVVTVDGDGDARADAVRDILRVGTSAGGARAKAVIAWNPGTGEVRSGQVEAEPGFSYWLLKFDGVAGNRDKELEDPRGYGLIEFAYYRMALRAGIEMNECRLLEENGRAHFVTKRFDRTDAGGKLHMQTLCGLDHLDFNLPGAHSYEQAMLAMRELGLPMESVEELFRRMVFNVVARNQDDHVKNIAFLMDKSGRWSLAPAYDLTYSYNPEGRWTSQHQMTVAGKRGGFELEDFEACAATVSLKRGRAGALLEEVRAAVRAWPAFAAEAGVPDETAERIARAHRLDIGARG